ncbi:MAG: response regulator [Gammaproteobacteria bacterium]|nr:response regulator [Gammaproteobacteria bacterium]
MSSALIVDDEPGIRSFLQKGLEKRFSLVEVAGDADTAEALHQRCHFDLIIADIRLPGRSGVEWVTHLREQDSNTAVIFISAYADMQTAIEALRAGAADFIMKPFRLEQLLASVERCMERQRMQRENFVLRRQVGQYFHGSGIVGHCDLIKNVCELVKRIAPMPSTVLIEGESGTGKELVARAIHEYSYRTGSFVPINCGAVSAELLESELFGHVKGAFTGAHQAREGLFTYANGGTLFLDEIGEMPLSMQAHLLRVMEERTIRPVGSNREIPVDVRVIAATNRDLEDEVKKGNFREDLYYRLFVLAIRMPALRERMNDLPELAQHFINTLSTEMGITPISISDEEMDVMRHYAWPGNVRELKNLIERCLLLNTTPSQCLAAQPASSRTDMPLGDNLNDLSLDELEKRHILNVLQAEGGNKSAAARKLGVSRKTLERKVQSWEEEAAV